MDNVVKHRAQELAVCGGLPAMAVDRQGRHREAADLMRASLALRRRAHPEEHPAVAGAIFDLASVLSGAGDHASADSLIRYGLSVQRRLTTADLLRGMAGPPTLSVGPTANELTGSIQRAFTVESAPAAKVGTVRSGDSSRIVFATDRHGPDPVGDHGNPEIYIMNPDGSDQRRLTNEKSADNTPVLSPDGSRIAFASQRGGGGFDIFVMNADGTDQRRLTDFTKLGIGAVNPSWSPDGKRVLFRSRVKRLDIYVINLDGTGLVKLTDEPRGVVMPAWSPDGRKIAFGSLRHGEPEIYTMNADGSGHTRLTFNTSRDNRPAWSPDSRRIAFHSDRDGEMEIYVMNADGSEQRRLTTNPTEDGHPSWSPDGKRIVFHRRVLGHGTIFTMNADGSDVKRLTEISPVAFSGFPNWGRAKQ